jgi:hypothetical protein
MKILFQVVIAFALMLWLSISSVDLIGRFFIKDTAELYGSSIMGSDVQFKDFSVSWLEKSVSLRDICSPAQANSSLFCAGSILVQFQSDFSPDLKRESFFAELWMIDAIQIKDIVLFYDIDSEGSGLNNQKLRLSELSAGAMRDRLNAKAKNTAVPLLMEVKNLQVSGIKVDARSQKNPDLSKVFFISDMAFAEVGSQEGGITAAEILDRITRGITDKVQTEAEKQGLIETRVPSSEGRLSRKHSAAKGDEGSEGAAGKSGPGEAFRSIGTGIKKTSQEVWQKLFH